MTDRPRRLPTAAFAVTFAVSLVALFLPEAPDTAADVPGLDKVVHLLLFAALALSAVWRFGRSRRVVLLLLGYAAASEVIQGLALPKRGGDVLDLVADVAGTVAGLLVARARGLDAWWADGAGSVAPTSAPDEVTR